MFFYFSHFLFFILFFTMFRNHYVSYKQRQNYIRYPRNTFKTSLNNKRYSHIHILNNNCIRIEYDNEDNEVEVLNEDYEMQNDYYEMPNEVNIDYEDFFNYKVLNEELADDEVLNDNEDNYEMPNEESFDDEMLNEEEPNNEVSRDEEYDKIADKALNTEQMLSINGEFAPYFENVIKALMFCWIQKHNICKI